MDFQTSCLKLHRLLPRHRGAFFLLVLVVLTLSLSTYGTAHAGFYTGQSFNAPMESPTTYGKWINYDYGAVTNAILGSLLMKAGFFLVFLLTIIKIGFRTQNGLRDAGAYLLAIILLAGPIFNGKSILLWAADASDSLTLSIVNQIGPLNYQSAGSAVAAMMAQSKVTNDVLNKWRNEIWQFRKDCYNAYTKQQMQQGTPTTLKPSEITYSGLTPDNLSIWWNSNALQNPSTNCDDYKQQLESNLNSDFQDYLKQYQTDVTSNQTGTGVQISPEDQKIYNNLANVTPDELLNTAVYKYDHDPQDDKQPGFWQSLYNAFFTSRGWDNLIMLIPRLAITITGIFFVYIFNYYIFQLVTVIKIVAAMGMAFGVLYYMFFRKLELPLAALGIWVFGNGWYILAAIAMNQYWSTIDSQSAGTKIAQVLLGAQGAVSDGLFAVGLVGIMGSILAGILSWKGVMLSMHHAPGVQAARMGRLSSSGSTGGSTKTGGGASGSSGSQGGGGR